MRKNQARRSRSWRPCAQKLREDTHKLREENATLEGMVESCDELITEIARKIGLDRMGEDAKDEEKDEDADAPSATAPEEVVEEEGPVEMVPK
jgi:hypothetical protein